MACFPKNLAVAFTGEVNELLEHFQWLTGDQSAELSPEQLEEVAHEIADVQIYLAALADRLGVEIEPAVERKMALEAALKQVGDQKAPEPSQKIPVQREFFIPFLRPEKRDARLAS